jgi:hypothetical protein
MDGLNHIGVYATSARATSSDQRRDWRMRQRVFGDHREPAEVRTDRRYRRFAHRPNSPSQKYLGGVV